MFNYNDLKVTLTVTPEISPVNFYDKEESEKLFVKDVENNFSVHGRVKGSWVQIDDGYSKIYCVFSQHTSAEAFIESEDYKQSKETLFVGNIVDVEAGNETDGYTMWICSSRPVRSIKTRDSMPVDFIDHDERVVIDGVENRLYSIENLNAGSYSLIITVQ